MKPARRAPTVLAIAAVAVSGCAYFNGMYYANHFARLAAASERAGRVGEARDRWQQADMHAESVRFEQDSGAGSDPMRFILNDLQENEHLRESSRLAAIMERTLGQVHPAEARGVKQAGFAVLATSYMPAVLVELGYGSNPDEARYLTASAIPRARRRWPATPVRYRASSGLLP